MFRINNPTLLFLFSWKRTNALSREIKGGKGGCHISKWWPSVVSQRYRGYNDITESALSKIFFPIVAKKTEVELLSAKIMVHESIGNHHLS